MDADSPINFTQQTHCLGNHRAYLVFVYLSCAAVLQAALAYSWSALRRRAAKALEAQAACSSTGVTAAGAVGVPSSMGTSTGTGGLGGTPRSTGALVTGVLISTAAGAFSSTGTAGGMTLSGTGGAGTPQAAGGSAARVGTPLTSAGRGGRAVGGTTRVVGMLGQWGTPGEASLF